MNIEKTAYLKSIINDSEWHISELPPAFMVEIQLCKINRRNVYIYGASIHAYSLIRYLKSENIVCKAVFDIDESKMNNKIYDVDILCPFLLNAELDENAVVFITTSYFEGNTLRDIVNVLLMLGLKDWYALNEIDKQSLLSQYPQYWWIDACRDYYYKKNQEMIIKFSDMLYDETSFQILCDYLKSYCSNSPYKGIEIKTSYKYFYDLEKKELYKHYEDEVRINCGASVGDTIFCYVGNGLSASKIYAIECDAHSVAILKSNISKLPEEYRGKIEVVETYIDSNYKLDDVTEKITLINIDIEGGELELINAMKDRIIRERPVLAIAMYHKKEDIENLMNYFMEIKNYTYMIRKYASWKDIHNHNHELILYAIPNERLAL